MKALRYSLFILIFAGFGLTASAQHYSSAVGLRLGIPLSLSYKTFINEDVAVEGILGFRNRRFLGFGYTQINIVGLVQFHNDLASIDELRWYYGGGAGAYIFSFDNGFGFDGNDDGTLSIGISGNLGAEYTLTDTPVSVSIDWLPTFFINGFGSGFGAGYGAVGIRYVLGR